MFIAFVHAFSVTAWTPRRALENDFDGRSAFDGAKTKEKANRDEGGEGRHDERDHVVTLPLARPSPREAYRVVGKALPLRFLRPFHSLAHGAAVEDDPQKCHDRREEDESVREEGTREGRDAQYRRDHHPV